MSQGCSCDCGHRCWDEASDTGPVDLSDRAIRPLPQKRLRLHAAPVQLDESLVATPKQLLTSAASASSSSESDSDADDRLTRDARAAARARAASQSVEAGRGQLKQGFQEHLDGAAQDRWEEDDGAAPHPDRLADEAHDGSTHTSNSHEHESTASESPPTSPASVSPRIKSESQVDQGPAVLFGDEGRRIVDSLTTASSFSPAGLFGGLGLATLHPSLAPNVDRDFVDEEDILEGDEDSYGIVDRSHPPVEPTIASQQAAMALVVGPGGSNKKKRKVPGLAETRDVNPVAESVGTSTGQTATPAQPIVNSLPSDPRELFAEKGLLAPLNPPRTAEAALAKWRIRPPHVSLCITCYSSRRSRRKRFRRDEAKLPPVALPAVPAFVPPAQPREGPPRLPPGSGAKGSKAIKLAMKAAKEREKEKERVRNLFGQIRLPDLWDPQGTSNPSPGFVTRSIKADLDRKRRSVKEAPPAEPYPTPPDSADGTAVEEPTSHSFLDASPPQLDLFTFFERPPDAIESRWTALNDQKVRLKAAKERAAKAREEEERRRKEKEARDARDEDAPPLADAPVPEGAPSTTLAPPFTNGAAAPMRVPPPHAAATAFSNPSAGPRSKQARPQASADTPPAPASGPGGPPPAAPLPPTPAPASTPAPSPLPPATATPRKAPPKKGKKKRSAHANALNVHHRDNYVPSRAPAPGQAAQEPPPRFMSWPASEEAIASAGPFASTCGGGHYCSPDEWLCLFCEYELFYGEESLLYKAVRRRKNVLKVRKKAQDRANKATHAPETSATPSSGTPGAHPHHSHARQDEGPIEAKPPSPPATPEEVS
ncbi:hypothetical protein JCM10908_001763 [Rhodotorula pacifica]|uniref:uncharacterized protein n=1 Tax=Rhodotorula pacifica TaxID=1495444 RepID=UPI00316BBA6A